MDLYDPNEDTYEEAQAAKFQDEYKVISPNDWQALIRDFLESMPPIHGAEQRQEQLLKLLLAPDPASRYSFEIEAGELIDFSPTYGLMLLRHPDTLLSLCDCALIDVQERMMESDVMKQQRASGDISMLNRSIETVEENDDVMWSSSSSVSSSSSSLRGSVKRRVTMRIVNLPPSVEFNKRSVSSLRSFDVGGLVQIPGTVVRTGMVKMLELSREYECCRCGHTFFVAADMEQGNILEAPTLCPMVGNPDKPCKSTKFTLLGSETTDYQEVRMQEHVERLAVGSVPRAITVLLEHDLVDQMKAGDDVRIVGRLMRRWAPVQRGVRVEIRTVLRANSVRRCGGDDEATSLAAVGVSSELAQEFEDMWECANELECPLLARNFIIKAVCPQIYGLFTLKLCLLLTIVGGVQQQDHVGMHVRSESHMLIVGDPGTGKSQFLRFASQLSPRSVLTTGTGTTSAGLTASAVRDGGEWTLEAGALVLADRGVCCIDEFCSIREQDRASIHEAMEQQTISIAKAGIVCRLNTRATIFAVTNPKRRYDVNESVSANTGIAPPLLSRFDIIVVLLDINNSEWDREVSTFILRQACGMPGKPPSAAVDSNVAAASASHRGHSQSSSDSQISQDDMHSNSQSSSSSRKRQLSTGSHSAVGRRKRSSGTFLTNKAFDDSTEAWGVDKLRKYIAYCRRQFKPLLTEEARRVLTRYWEMQRSSGHRNAARTTVRMLESLIRLSQAHARIMFRDKVIVVDAVVAVQVVDISFMNSGLFQVENVMHSDFPSNPDAEYQLAERLVLDRLRLYDLGMKSDSAYADRTGSQFSMDHELDHPSWDPYNSSSSSSFMSRRGEEGHSGRSNGQILRQMESQGDWGIPPAPRDGTREYGDNRDYYPPGQHGGSQAFLRHSQSQEFASQSQSRYQNREELQYQDLHQIEEQQRNGQYRHRHVDDMHARPPPGSYYSSGGVPLQLKSGSQSTSMDNVEKEEGPLVFFPHLQPQSQKINGHEESRKVENRRTTLESGKSPTTKDNEDDGFIDTFFGSQ